MTDNGGSGISPSEFAGWLGRAEPLDSLEYWRGNLSLAREQELIERRITVQDMARHKKCSKAGIEAEGSVPRLVNNLAEMAWNAACLGRVELAQRRNGTQDFSYLAIARSAP